MITDPHIAAKVHQLLRESSELINSAAMLVKEHCPEDEFESFRDGISKILAETLIEVLNPLYFLHPDLAPLGLRIPKNRIQPPPDAPKVIATRDLTYSLNADPDSALPMQVRVFSPRPARMRPEDTTPATDSVCTVEFHGLPYSRFDCLKIHGIDSIQSLSLALNIDRFLRNVERNHALTFRWAEDGSAYFDESAD
ncbi:hypothetical protein [Lysobacter sp. CA199]|uniref:hypothetical protein n=1 Tax=Lysobacter sp. CA199 TaxID=3455608 RepID=UPI003F8D1B5A